MKRKYIPQYQIWSTQRPALMGRKVYGGTIQHLLYGTTRMNPAHPLPEGTTLSQIHWMGPLLDRIKNPSTRSVAGSKGQTYTVTTYHDGTVTCTCPGYQFRRTCKHLAP